MHLHYSTAEPDPFRLSDVGIGVSRLVRAGQLANERVRPGPVSVTWGCGRVRQPCFFMHVHAPSTFGSSGVLQSLHGHAAFKIPRPHGCPGSSPGGATISFLGGLVGAGFRRSRGASKFLAHPPFRSSGTASASGDKVPGVPTMSTRCSPTESPPLNPNWSSPASTSPSCRTEQPYPHRRANSPS